MRIGISLILMCGCAMTAMAREELRRDFRKVTPLAAGRTLRVENGPGNVTIHTQAKNEVDVMATIHCSADNAAAARTCLDQIQVRVENAAGGVSARTDVPNYRGWRNVSFSVDYEIMMPDTAPLDLRNRFGAVLISNIHAGGSIHNNNGRVILTGGRGRQDIENSFGPTEVRGNEGDVTVRTGNGDVVASDITGTLDISNRFARVRVNNAGRGVTIHSNNGDISVENAGGNTLVTNSFGPVVATEIKGDLNVQNQNGEVRATGITGIADLRTTFGGVRFMRIGKALTVRASNSTITGENVGESATMETTFGGIDVRGVKGSARATGGNSSIRLNGIGGEAFAKSSFNGIQIDDVAGSVTVENSNGSVTVNSRPGPRCQPISLSTTFGPIRVSLPPGLGYNVAAHTSFGNIHSEPDVTVNGVAGRDALNGKIAGGGCDLRLNGQNSNIDISKVPVR